MTDNSASCQLELVRNGEPYPKTCSTCASIRGACVYGLTDTPTRATESPRWLQGWPTKEGLFWLLPFEQDEDGALWAREEALLVDAYVHPDEGPQAAVVVDEWEGRSGIIDAGSWPMVLHWSRPVRPPSCQLLAWVNGELLRIEGGGDER